MLNLQKGNMYGFVTHTWNTIKGECMHNCSYCYMKKFGKQNPVRLDEKEFKTDLGKNNYIFVGSGCDIFADNIPTEWIRKTIDYCLKFDNSYLFQTKNPDRMQYYNFPKKTVLCVTIESNYDFDSNNLAPCIATRVRDFYGLKFEKKMITIEPIMDFNLNELSNIISVINPFQVNIGADTCHSKLREPTPDKIKSLIEFIISAGIKIHVKKNLNRLLNDVT